MGRTGATAGSRSTQAAGGSGCTKVIAPSSAASMVRLKSSVFRRHLGNPLSKGSCRPGCTSVFWHVLVQSSNAGSDILHCAHGHPPAGRRGDHCCIGHLPLCSKLRSTPPCITAVASGGQVSLQGQIGWLHCRAASAWAPLWRAWQELRCQLPAAADKSRSCANKSRSCWHRSCSHAEATAAQSAAVPPLTSECFSRKGLHPDSASLAHLMHL